MKNNEGQRRLDAWRLDYVEIVFEFSFKNDLWQQQQIKELFRMRGQTILRRGIKLMAELFIVAEWVTSCQPALSLMLVHCFFFLLKNLPPHPDTATLKYKKKKLWMQICWKQWTGSSVSSKPREGKPVESFHLPWGSRRGSGGQRVPALWTFALIRGSHRSLRESSSSG